MIIRRMLVLSGFEGKVGERLRSRLESRQITVVFVASNDDISVYFDKLLARLSQVVSQLKGDNVRIIGLALSCFDIEADMQKEDDIFFPLLRIKRVGKIYRRDINLVDKLSAIIEPIFKQQDILSLSRSFNKPIDERLLLPVKNCKSSKVVRMFQSIYRLETFVIPVSIDKEINKVKNTGSWRIRGLDFKGIVNKPEHPVRRCSDLLWCDIAAELRFGFEVSERFEFDVTCENGLKHKRFSHCANNETTITSDVSHLNMRINDDFKQGGLG